MAKKQVEVKLLRSIGTSRGVLNAGSVSAVEERVANSWVEAGFAEIVNAVEEPEEKPEQDAPEENKESSEALEVPEADAPEEKKPAGRKTGAKK